MKYLIALIILSACTVDKKTTPVAGFTIDVETQRTRCLDPNNTDEGKCDAYKSHMDSIEKATEDFTM